MTITRSPYKGTSRQLVLAFDIGTTYSGVSYALLDPGFVPEIKSVGRFLNNREIGSFKIPSILYYDHKGRFRGVKGTVDDDEAEGLYEVRWWKMRMSRGELPPIAKKRMTPELPKGKSLQDIFADFIRYLFDSAKTFIQECEPMGKVLWESLERNIDFILSHPNGWEGREQEFLRKSVVQASVVPEEEALSRVSFVTEGEATFNFCVTNTKSGEFLEPGHKVLVVDAGGGTVDISSYTVKSTSPLKVEEFHEPKCIWQGGEVVTIRARTHAESRFKGSKFDNEQDLVTFTESFDTGLKAIFSDNSKPQFVRFGSPRDTDVRCGVKGGKITLQGKQVDQFFEPSVKAVIEGIKSITAETDPANTFVFLAGGFGGSPWIFQEVGNGIATQGLKLSRPDTQTNKAVAVGAISYYLDQFVVGRIVRSTYGTTCTIKHDPLDPAHRKRTHKKILGATGEYKLEIFAPTLFRGTRVSGTEEFRNEFARISPQRPVAGEVVKFPVICYSGKKKNPQWVDEEPGKFKTRTHIPVVVSKVPHDMGMSLLGFPIYIHKLDVIFIYGQTEFKAQMAWKEGGIEKRSDVAILYDDE